MSSSGFGFNNVPTANFGGTIGTLSGNQFTDQQGGRQSSNLVTLAGVYTATSKLVFDGRYSRGFLNEKIGNYFVPETVQIFSCGTPNAAFPCATTGANTITGKDVSIRESYEFSAAYIFNAGGQHELRGGYQRFTIFNDVQSGNSTVGRISFNYGTSITTLIGGNVTATPGAVGSGSFRRTGTNGHGSNLSQGIFIQDKYQPTSRLTLNLGVRFEKENLPSFNQFPKCDKFWLGRQDRSATWIRLRSYRQRQDEDFRQLRQVLRPGEVCASARFVRRRYFPRRLFRDLPGRYFHQL